MLFFRVFCFVLFFGSETQVWKLHSFVPAKATRLESPRRPPPTRRGKSVPVGRGKGPEERGPGEQKGRPGTASENGEAGTAKQGRSDARAAGQGVPTAHLNLGAPAISPQHSLAMRPSGTQVLASGPESPRCPLPPFSPPIRHQGCLFPLKALDRVCLCWCRTWPGPRPPPLPAAA